MSLFRRTEARTINGMDLFSNFSAGGNSPNFGRSATSALRLVPLYAATSMIADTFSILPMAVYSEAGGVRQRLEVQPALMTSPHINPVFTRIEWLHQFASSFLLRGNAYGLITAVDSVGVASKIAWLQPDLVSVDETHAIPVYSYNGKVLDISTVVHVPWYPVPGSVVGLSPIGQFRLQMETGMSAAQFGSNWFRNGTTPSGHLKFSAGPLDSEKSAIAKERFKAAVAGNDVFVSGNDWDWKALSVSPEEAQFLETIKATANQIAAIYRVDPQDIGGESGNSMTYTTLEMNQIKFQTRALQPIFVRLESHIDRLLPAAQYMKFNPDAIVRTDLAARSTAHEINLRSGIETQDEGRALEDRAPMTPAELDHWQKYYGKQLPKPITNGGA